MSRYQQGACPKCNSSDAFTIYEDTGWGNCYSCEAKLSPEEIEKEENEMDRPTNSVQPVHSNESRLLEISSFGHYNISTRHISEETVRFFKVTLDPVTRSHFYPYTKANKIVAYKERKEPKAFQTHGDFKNTELFGQQQAASLGGKKLVITEGELDALAMSEAFHKQYGKYWPVVSIPSASGTKVLLEQREWLQTFTEVVLMFDQDEAGQKATETAAKIIGAGKVKIAKLQEKDPCDELVKHGYAKLMSSYWNAQTYSPAGILVGEQIWEKYLERENTESIPYPACISGLNDKIRGMRQGEITLLTSGTGSGKSTITKEIILHLLATTDSKVGVISLEESIGDTTEQLVNMHLKSQTETPESFRKGFDEIFKDERIVLLDHQGSVSDASLTDKIEYMALMGCTHLFLDHITIAVSEGTDGLSGNEAVDKMMSDLLKIVKKHNVWLGLISHLRKSFTGKAFEEGHLPTIDDIKGSGSIKQISFDIIAFARNLVAEDENEKKTVKFRVLKSRFTGLTGDAGAAIYDRDSGRLTEVSKDFAAIE